MQVEPTEVISSLAARVAQREIEIAMQAVAIKGLQAENADLRAALEHAQAVAE